MKKTILLLLTFSLILSLFSCTTPTETTPLSEETDTLEPEYTDESETGYLLVHIDKIFSIVKNGDFKLSIPGQSWCVCERGKFFILKKT